MSCLGDAAAALVDGELGHAARERALRHLTGCLACRAEVVAQRTLKSSLAAGPEPAPHDALTARLLAMPGPSRGIGQRPGVGQGSGAGQRPGFGQPGASARLGPPAPMGAPRPARRSVVVGTAVALSVGTAAAFALGAPPEGPATTPVDPGRTTFVTDFVSTTGDGVVVNARLPGGGR